MRVQRLTYPFFLTLFLALTTSHGAWADDQDSPPQTGSEQPSDSVDEPVEEVEVLNEDFLRSRMGQEALAEKLREAKVAQLQGLPGGVYKAPKIFAQIQKVVNEFQATKFVDSDAVFELFIASAPEINGWVSQVHSIKELKVYHVVLTKGLIDAICDYATCRGNSAENKEGYKGSLAMLAGVIAHEFGHAMHDDLEKVDKRQTGGVFFEFDADTFGTELLAEAGYDPEAMIHLLTMLGQLHNNKSLQSLVAQMLDEHPKANYRIANIEPTISVLKAPTSLLNESKQIPYEKRYKVVDIDRTGPESASRTSLSGFQKHIGKPKYQELSYVDRLRELERYLIFHPNTGSDGMAMSLYVAILGEYRDALSKADSAAEVDSLIASLRKFEDQIGGFASATHTDSERNVKRTLKSLRTAIVDRQIEYLDFNNLDLDAIRTWGREVDYELALGAMTRLINRSGTTEEILSIVDYVHDYDKAMQRRHNWLRSPEHQVFRNNKLKLIETAVVRHLHLTQNMEETLDFIHRVMPLSRQQGNSIATGEGLTFIMAGLLQYCLTHEGMEWSNFHERLNSPKTAEDRNLARIVFQDRGNIAGSLFHRRGLGRSPDPTSRNFSYNIGRRFRGFEDIDPNVVTLLYRTLHGQAVNIVFNDLIKTHYTLREVLDLLSAESETTAQFIKQHRETILNAGDGNRAREIQAHLKNIVDRLHHAGVEGYELPFLKYTLRESLEYLRANCDQATRTVWESIEEEVKAYYPRRESFSMNENLALLGEYLGSDANKLDEAKTGLLMTQLDQENAKFESFSYTPEATDILQTYSRAENIIKNNLQRVHSRFVESPSFQENASTFRRRGLIPDISSRWFARLTMDERVEIIDNMYKLQSEQTLLDAGQDFLDTIGSVEEALTELVAEERLTEQAKSEYLEALSATTELAGKFIKGEAKDVPVEFYAAQRRCRLLTMLLESSTSPITSKISSETRDSLWQGLGLGTRLSATQHAVGLINRAMVMDKHAAISYMEDPSKPSKVVEDIRAISQLADVVAKYEGLATVDRSVALSAISVRNTLIRHVFFPATEGSEMKSGQVVKSDLRQSLLLSQEQQANLLQLGEGFKDFLEAEARRAGERTLENDFVEEVLRDLWPLQLQSAVESPNSKDALVHTLGFMSESTEYTNEEVVRSQYVLLSRALANVNSAEQMDFFAAVFARYLAGHSIGVMNGLELLNADLNKVMDVSAARYREHFYDHLVAGMEKYQVENGGQESLKFKYLTLKTKFLTYLARKAHQYEQPYELEYEDTPYVFRVWVLRSTLFPLLVERDRYRQWWQQRQRSVAERLTRTLLAKGMESGKFSRDQFFHDARLNTPWSEELDRSVAEYIREGKFEGWNWNNSRRRKAALEMVKQIRSLNLRQEMYDYVIKTYGELKVGWIQKMKDRWNLYRAYQRAEALWTTEVLEQLRQAQSVFAAFKITEKAWENHVKKRCARIGVTREEAYQRLLELHSAKQTVENPYGAEVADVFIEGSRHRDEFLERHAKGNNKTYEQLEMLEEFKSKNAITPYHKIAKALFEFLDEHVSRLTPEERARVALYLADFDKTLDDGLERKLTEIFHGSRNRRKAIRSRGVYFSLKEIKQFFLETHTEERTLAFQALFSGTDGIAENPEAEQTLVDRLLFSDSNMPKYLEGVLRIYVKRMDHADRSILLSHMLANSNGKDLSGPDVLHMVVTKGGAVAAKMAQLIASHGFKLDSEYQRILEVFKGKAQNIDKIVALKWIAERLPPELYREIKYLGKELGSGSLKLAYLAELRDGRLVVIKLAREYAKRKVVRELLLLREMIADVQEDPDLRIDGLENLGGEVERILLDEMDFSEEYKLEREHKQAASERPLLVRIFGNDVTVYYPQPLEGWQTEDILVEEYVKAGSWNDLPESGVMGWTKERLAKAAINEVLNQFWSFLGPDEVREDGRIILDIDPHEENQLARQRGTLRGRQMVNIDLGQSVRVDPLVLKGIAKVIYQIDQGEMETARDLVREFVELNTSEKAERFLEVLRQQSANSSDAIEIFSKTLEEVEIEGIALKPEYLFFQKLFATLVGLNRHISDSNYLSKQVKRIVVLRALSNPRHVWSEIKDLKDTEFYDGPIGGGCPNSFLSP